jgi:hypothetical protein
MIHSTRFTCVLDTCVIYPIDIRDILLWWAYFDLYQPKWGQIIFVHPSTQGGPRPEKGAVEDVSQYFITLISAERVTERANTTRPTLLNIEKGSASVALGAYACMLFGSAGSKTSLSRRVMIRLAGSCRMQGFW